MVSQHWRRRGGPRDTGVSHDVLALALLAPAEPSELRTLRPCVYVGSLFPVCINRASNSSWVYLLNLNGHLRANDDFTGTGGDEEEEQGQGALRPQRPSPVRLRRQPLRGEHSETA